MRRRIKKCYDKFCNCNPISQEIILGCVVALVILVLFMLGGAIGYGG